MIADLFPPAEVTPSKRLNSEQLVARMADEGVPISAIARATDLPNEEVRRLVTLAVTNGDIVERPQEDWPPTSSRMQRKPAFVPSNLDRQFVCTLLSKLFRMTHLEARFLYVLMRHRTVYKAQLHQVIEDKRQARGPKETTDIKMVDVMVCKVRAKINPAKDPEGLCIETLWGQGYELSDDTRKRLFELLGYTFTPEEAASAGVVLAAAA